MAEAIDPRASTPEAPLGYTLDGKPRRHLRPQPWDLWLYQLEKDGKVVLHAGVDYQNKVDRIAALYHSGAKYVGDRFRRRLEIEMADNGDTLTMTLGGPLRHYTKRQQQDNQENTP